MRSIFPILSLDRKRVKWEDYLLSETPYELLAGRWYKREDAFAPLGYGGINGTKLRQLIFLVREAKARGARGILTGASLLSPQVSMSALVGKHFGLPVRIVLGGTRPETAGRHENVRIAREAGAEFSYVPVAYNPCLQRGVRDLAQLPEHRRWFRLPYAISVQEPAADEELVRFHRATAEQIRGFPRGVETLALAFGSGNSAASVLYGLALYPPPDLERVVLFQVGPSRREWLEERLTALRRTCRGDWEDYPREYVDLHGSGYATYGDQMAFSHSGIEFHPTYEGKVLTYMAGRREEFRWWWEDRGSALFWIVGSKPRAEAMRGALGAGETRIGVGG